MSDWLDQLVGAWTFESASVPDDPAHRRSGLETVARKGAWVVIDTDDGASRFQLAMCPDSGRVTGDFVHWAHAHLWTYEGAVEADGKLHLRSRGPNFDVEGEDADYDDVIEIVSPDERVLTSRQLGPDGAWRDFIVTRHRRKAR